MTDTNAFSFDWNIEDPEIEEEEHKAPEPAPPPMDLLTLRNLLRELEVNKLQDIKLIEYLVQNEYLVSSDIKKFVEAAKENTGDGQSFSSYAMASQIASEEDLITVTANLHSMQVVQLVPTVIEDKITKIIKAEQAAEWKVFPYSRDDLGQLLVATASPDDILSRSNLEQYLPRENNIQWRLTTPTELNTAIQQYYDPENAGVLESATKSIEETDIDADKMVVRDIAVQAPVITLVNDIIQQAQEAGASDIHIEPKEDQTYIRFRIDGMLRDIHKVSRTVTPQIISRIKTLGKMRNDERRIPQDGRVPFNIGKTNIDLRVVSVPTIYGEQITMRLLDPTQALLTLEDLGMSEENLKRYEEAIKSPYGCAFITGPTGTGKSTTLYSSLGRVVNPEKKLISIEDPVEYRLKGISQIDIAQHKLGGEDAKRMTFASALRAILRSDPDIVMVGEIRDQETAKIAIDAALTGHFLYSTLHTNDAISTITRLGQLGIDKFLLAEATRVIVAQRLIRRLCVCKKEEKIDEEFLRTHRAPEWAYEKLKEEGGKKVIYDAKPGGCPRCKGLGYKGRTGVHEVVLMTSELQEAILEDRNHSQMEKIVRKQGMESLRDDALHKVWQGISSWEEMERVVL